jgi:hypothetical protein
MDEPPEVIHRWADWHHIRLEVLAGTHDRIQMIKCPTCEKDVIVIPGDLIGVLPYEPGN